MAVPAATPGGGAGGTGACVEIVNLIIDWVLHLDAHLDALVNGHGVWTYVVLFLIIFAETGLVVTPFLPGDSLLFATGALAAAARSTCGRSAVAVGAAILGDAVNYWIGRLIGPQAFHGEEPFLKREHLVRTHGFYERHGGKTIIIARFVPIVRTFAPFVAGVGRMCYAASSPTTSSGASSGC